MKSAMGNETRDYDLIVIGGGPAGIQGATTARILGKTVVLVDRHHELGGAGANTGTIPSKTLRETAVALSGLRSRDLYGVDLSLRRQATVTDFLRHERHVKHGMNSMFAQQLEEYRADVIYGDATFVDSHTIRVQHRSRSEATDTHKEQAASNNGEQILRGEKILIATGSSPVRPQLFPFGPSVYDSDTLLNLERLPEVMAIVGAGTIGSEYACTFAALGTKVHVVDGRDVLMSFLDGELSRALEAAMERNGIVFHWKERAETCTVDEPASPGKPARVTLTLTSGKTLTVNEVLVAAGRKSNTENLNLEAAGVETADRGLIKVNEDFRSNVPNIYAAGDVIGFPALASTSMEQARRAVRHAFGHGVYSGTPRPLPHGIWTIPEIGTVGETEESLKKQGIEYIVGRADYKNNARGRIIGDQDGFLKLLFRLPKFQLVGVHVLGELATDVVHIGLVAMLCQARAGLFDATCFNVPTLGALYKLATFDAMRNAEREVGISAKEAMA
jgi:NAD(P) transhydrogenase